MRILHTSDWHLGKTLEGFSRIEEQEKFLKEFTEIVEEKDIDMVIIAGDIYDNGNPSAKAEEMFYSCLKDITSSRKRCVLVISGNHDSPERLAAVSSLAKEYGIIISSTPKTVIEKGKYGDAEVTDSGEGYIELNFMGEKLVALTIPYPSEKRLNEIFLEDTDTEKICDSYSEKISELFHNLSLRFRDDTINILVSHLYMQGGEITDSERPIELGGAFTVNPAALPEKAQYIALGHLHRPQKVKGTNLNAYYSGSPLQYSKSERNYSKGCYIADVHAGENAQVEQVLFSNPKPIQVWRCKGVDEAIEKCRANADKDVWVYLEIITEEYISQEDIKTMKELKKDILQILPIIKKSEEAVTVDEERKEKSVKELFTDFYKYKRVAEPDDEIIKLFLSIVNDEEGEKFEA